MSLREAVIDIAEAMETNTCGMDMTQTLGFYAKQLRIACKAAGDAPAVRDMSSVLISPEAQHAREIARARSEFSKKKDPIFSEEKDAGDMVTLIGGPAAPDGASTVVSIDPFMPVGSFTMISGAVYKLNQDSGGVRTLNYDAEQTKKRLPQNNAVV